MTTLSNFEREMKAKRNAETHPFLKCHYSIICLAIEALKEGPVTDLQREQLIADLQTQAGYIAHRQAQGGGG